MWKLVLIVVLGLLACVRGVAADEFDTISCGREVPEAIIGKHSSNERVVITEARHKNLGLKDLGGIEISGRLFVISWRICGGEFEELVNTRKNLVRDVLRMPAHSLYSPQSFFEGCRVAGKAVPDAVIAILDNRRGEKPKAFLEQIVLPAKVAWKIDERLERFVPMPTQGLSCAVSGSSPDFK